MSIDSRQIKTHVLANLDERLFAANMASKRFIDRCGHRLPIGCLIIPPEKPSVFGGLPVRMTRYLYLNARLDATSVLIVLLTKRQISLMIVSVRWQDTT